MRIPLFVTATGILLVIAAGFALGLRVLSRSFHRPYVHAWYQTWTALGVYAAAAGASLLAVNRPELAALRQVVGVVSLVAAWLHLHSLGVGIRDLCTPRERLPRWRVRLVGGLLFVAIVMLLAPPLAFWPTPMERYLARLSLVALAWGVAYYHAGLTVLRRFPATAGIGRATLAVSLIAYGSLRLLEPMMHLVGPSPVLAQLLTFGGIPLLVGMGAGMLMVLLEVERERSVTALEARAAAERSAADSEALLATALARREAWFRSMIENSSDIILEISPDGAIDYASPATERILGLRADSLLGSRALSLVHPDDLPVVRDALDRAVAGDPTVPTTVTFRVRTAAGSFIQLEASSRPVTEPDGSPHLIVTARDVRDRVQLERELIAARRLESIGRLAGGVAHDFNNLLTALLGNVTMLHAHVDASTESQTLLDEITQSARRGAELTKRLLTFARRQQVAPRVVATERVIQELRPLLQRLLGEQHRLDFAFADALWPIRVDVGAFEQVLVNLVVNARDAMPEGGTLRISAENETIGASGRAGLAMPSGDWVRIDVRDTGIGMDPSVLAQVFEPFFTTKDRSGGTGLGLATSYGTVAQAGGHLRVASELGAGSTFSIYLPRSAPEQPADRSNARPSRRTPSTVPTLPRARSGETVLLIDDDDAVREITSKLLRRLGYAVIVASDGDEGVSQASSSTQRLDLVISGIVMPRMNGIEAVARIRRARPDVPIIFISGYTDQASLWEADATPPGPLLRKPFSLDELAEATRVALDSVLG